MRSSNPSLLIPEIGNAVLRFQQNNALDLDEAPTLGYK